MNILILITARIRRMGKVMFSVCPHLGGGGGSVLSPARGSGPAGRGGQVQPEGGSVLSPAREVGGGSGPASRGGVRSNWGGQVQPGGGQVQLGGGGQVQLGRVRSSQGGVRSSQWGGGQHLVPSCGRYASCVHAGGLSC